MSRKSAKPDDLMATLKAAILAVLTDERSTPGDKNKAIELGIKLKMVEAKISKLGDGDGESFFGN